MSKMSVEPVRHALNGPTMGAGWSALFLAPPGFEPAPVQAALQAAVDAGVAQMSSWKPDSALPRPNAAPLGRWQAIPADPAQVLADHGLRDALGLRHDGSAWTLAVEAPGRDRRAPHSILTLQDAAAGVRATGVGNPFTNPSAAAGA